MCLQTGPRAILTQANRDALCGFVGYGVTSPAFVFLGPEEASEGNLLNLQVRGAFPVPIHDRVDACNALAGAYHANGLGTAARRYLAALQPGAEATWSLAAKLIAALRRRAKHPSLNGWQAEYLRLGTRTGDSLLAELFPLPKPGMGRWPAAYAVEFAYPDQDAYYADVWPRAVVPGAGNCHRADLMAATLARIPMSRGVTIVCYGRGGNRAEFWERFDQLFQIGSGWHAVFPRTPTVAEVA
ncbi:MAG TPA: hypothetical protein VMK12_20370, partial [Anaeromyxobacteraceae bacterium]|nr:hypothetical protein [Anaeromyxobacteraceae bacterium]